MSTVMEAIRKRRSIRRIKSDPISEEQLKSVLEAARLAPSWANSQCWRFVVVRDEEKRRQLAKAGGPERAMATAPAIIVACALPEQSGRRAGLAYFMLDVGMAVGHLILEATAQGLGTCWVGSFDEGIVRRVLNIPTPVEVVALIPIGYPDESPEPRMRKPLEEIVYWARWE